jgi:hypothetical protein
MQPTWSLCVTVRRPRRRKHTAYLSLVCVVASARTQMVAQPPFASPNAPSPLSIAQSPLSIAQTGQVALKRIGPYILYPMGLLTNTSWRLTVLSDSESSKSPTIYSYLVMESTYNLVCIWYEPNALYYLVCPNTCAQACDRCVNLFFLTVAT